MSSEIDGAIPEYLRYKYLAEQRKVDVIADLKNLSERTDALLDLMITEEHKNFALHSIRVATFAHDLALLTGEYNAEQAIALFYKGLLHDIGKIRTHNSVLDKRDRLTAHEEIEMQRHTFDSEDILAQTGFPVQVQIAGREHHVTLDGKGYPKEADTSKLDWDTLILTIADIHDAIGDPNRPYQKPGDIITCITTINRFFTAGQLDEYYREAYNKLFTEHNVYKTFTQGRIAANLVAEAMEQRGYELLNIYRPQADRILEGLTLPLGDRESNQS